MASCSHLFDVLRQALSRWYEDQIFPSRVLFINLKSKRNYLRQEYEKHFSYDLIPQVDFNHLHLFQDVFQATDLQQYEKITKLTLETPLFSLVPLCAGRDQILLIPLSFLRVLFLCLPAEGCRVYINHLMEPSYGKTRRKSSHFLEIYGAVSLVLLLDN